MRLPNEFRYNINSVLTTFKWSKVEVSKKKITLSCLLNKTQSQGRLNHKTMNTVKSWGQFLREEGVWRKRVGLCVKKTKGIFCSYKQKAGPEPREPGPLCRVKIKRPGDTAGLLIRFWKLKAGRGRCAPALG